MEIAGELDIKGLAENYKKKPENITPQSSAKVNRIKDKISDPFNKNTIHFVMEDMEKFSEDTLTLPN